MKELILKYYMVVLFRQFAKNLNSFLYLSSGNEFGNLHVCLI